MKEIPYKLCGTGNLLQWLEFPKSWRELGQSGSIKKEKVDDYRKVTNWMSWRNEVGDFSPNGLALGLLQKRGTKAVQPLR